MLPLTHQQAGRASETSDLEVSVIRSSVLHHAIAQHIIELPPEQCCIVQEGAHSQASHAPRQQFYASPQGFGSVVCLPTGDCHVLLEASHLFVQAEVPSSFLSHHPPGVHGCSSTCQHGAP